MAGYQKLEVLIREELDELIEEGLDLSREEYVAKIDACGSDKEKLSALYDSFSELKMREGYAYSEPDELDEILAHSTGRGFCAPSMKKAEYEHFHGAWLGRCIGCAVGQPVELWSGEAIREWYKTAGKYPLAGFVPTHSGDRVNNGLATDEKICAMPTDDDIRFTVLAYNLLANHGKDFDTYDVGANWVYTIPYRYICTAENQAYLNFANVDEFGPWGRPDGAMEILKKSKVNSYRNPYREWIGAQIRIDGYGYFAAGNPLLAAKLAYTDAALSHTKNGIYGAMFFAAFISWAFVAENAEQCFETAISFIPVKSRFYEFAMLARDVGRKARSAEEVSLMLEERMPKYHCVHTLNNAAICIASMIYAAGDFRKAVCCAVSCGMDTDCNGATVGSAMGALLGEENIPADLKDPLNDTFYCGVAPYEPGKISGFARSYYEMYLKNLQN